MDKLGKELAPIEDQLAKLEAVKSPDAATKKQIDKASANLRVNMMLIDVPAQANEKEVMKLPDWLKDNNKQKGIPLGKDVSIAPDVRFDFRNRKLTSIGITIHFP